MVVIKTTSCRPLLTARNLTSGTEGVRSLFGLLSALFKDQLYNYADAQLDRVGLVVGHMLEALVLQCRVSAGKTPHTILTATRTGPARRFPRGLYMAKKPI
jgi:hypothetical protein